jgi:CheY-like chemotaxis protein
MADGGKIIISSRNIYLDTPLKRYEQIEEGEYVEIEVSDTGIGMSKTDIENIFEPFYTRKKMGRSGSGLGMSVVWGTVKDHSGYIDIKSSEGQGTTISLYFPATRETLKEDSTEEPIVKYKGRGESILVIDDAVEQRKIATILLMKLGYSVASVSSGEEALEYLKNHSADLLVLDMIMDPGMDGLETYKRIIKRNPNQKAIIASGYSETEHVKEAQKLGAKQYVKKPYTLEKIGMAIRQELDRSIPDE